MGIDHYENFPVASLLCPPPVRPPIIAIYRFARTADDIADEGSAPTWQRLADLSAFQADLNAISQGARPSERWPQVFGPLARQMRQFRLPARLLSDLLEAFTQDVHNPSYPDRASVLDYCRRSANPIGRLLLHLYRVEDAASLQRSDEICSALQLINFCQDLGVDAPRGRIYMPQQDMAATGVKLEALRRREDSPAARELVRRLCDWAEAMMKRGAPLTTRLPGRAGWELRLVVQGGLRILEKIRRMDHATLITRPQLNAADTPLMLWRALVRGVPR